MERGHKIAQTTNWLSMGDIIENEAKDGLIHLYDGPPQYSPVGFHMVCFTSPTDDWLGVLSKSEWHPVLVMPLWDLRSCTLHLKK